MSFTQSPVAAMATAVTAADNGTDHEGPGRRWEDQIQGDLYTQLVISLALGVSAFLTFCVSECLQRISFCFL